MDLLSAQSIPVCRTRLQVLRHSVGDRGERHKMALETDCLLWGIGTAVLDKPAWRANRPLLVLVDYASGSPKAVTHFSIPCNQSADYLQGIFSRVGFLSVLSDQEPPFTSARLSNVVRNCETGVAGVLGVRCRVGTRRICAESNEAEDIKRCPIAKAKGQTWTFCDLP